MFSNIFPTSISSYWKKLFGPFKRFFIFSENKILLPLLKRTEIEEIIWVFH